MEGLGECETVDVLSVKVGSSATHLYIAGNLIRVTPNLGLDFRMEYC